MSLPTRLKSQENIQNIHEYQLSKDVYLIKHLNVPATRQLNNCNNCLRLLCDQFINYWISDKFTKKSRHCRPIVFIAQFTQMRMNHNTFSHFTSKTSVHWSLLIFWRKWQVCWTKPFEPIKQIRSSLIHRRRLQSFASNEPETHSLASIDIEHTILSLASIDIEHTILSLASIDIEHTILSDRRMAKGANMILNKNSCIVFKIAKWLAKKLNSWEIRHFALNILYEGAKLFVMRLYKIEKISECLFYCSLQRHRVFELCTYCMTDLYSMRNY
jgi:hypothetical protein